MKYVLYALGIKVAVTGVVLYVLWRRRQAALQDEFASDDVPYALDWLSRAS